MVESLTVNQVVVGSSPSSGANLKSTRKSDERRALVVVEDGDHTSINSSPLIWLGSLIGKIPDCLSGRCEFESRPGRQFV